jgi:hypothetical protein
VYRAPNLVSPIQQKEEKTGVVKRGVGEGGGGGGGEGIA